MARAKRWPKSTANWAFAMAQYRQAAILARQGINLDRSTLCDWVAKSCWWLRPLHGLILDHIAGNARVVADDTPLPTLERGLGRTMDGRLELDTNIAEREIRPVAVTRKAALFAGSEGGEDNRAIATTLIRTAILNGINPQATIAVMRRRRLRIVPARGPTA
ncbi:IS66 family transposase [Falsiroseomonas sp.]|uniref:IS66 family transposase n=1 Tax=Falsiroseomonas sp. TaxID=2870721 RepID=UPI003F72699D